MFDFSWLSFVSPEQAKLVFLGLFVLIGILVVRLPEDYVWKGAPKKVWWMNLKLWGLFVLGTIFVTYVVF